MTKKIIVHNPSHLATTSYKNLKDLQGNLKTITKENLEKLKQSIIKYGIFVPKFVWIEDRKNYWIEDGHQTIKALASLEKEDYVIPDIPYVKVECENKKDAAEKLLQINSRYGEINPETTFFEDFDIDLSFIENIEIPELDIKLEELESEIVEDEVPEPPTEPLSKTGDLWLCGKNRILCGDATKEADIRRLMDGKKADLIFTDPPYGMNMGFENDDLKDNKLKKWNDKWVLCLPKDATGFLSFHSPRLFWTMLDSAREHGWKFERIFTFYKPNDRVFPWHGWLMVSESILLFTKGKHKFNPNNPPKSEYTFWHDTYEWTQEFGL